MTPMRTACVFVAAAGLLLGAGCGKSDSDADGGGGGGGTGKATMPTRATDRGTGASTAGTVSGRVWINGVPVTGATIHFTTADGSEIAAPIRVDGTYTVAVDPKKTGQYKVTVQGLPDRGKSAAGSQKVELPSSTGARVPLKYSNPETSGLTAEVKPGSQTFDLDLK